MTCPIDVCLDGGSPTILYAASGIGNLARDDNNIYLMTTAASSTCDIVKVPIDGGSATTLAVGEPTGSVAESFIATDGVNVYWTLWTNGPNNVRQCSVDGCCMSPTTIAPTQNLPQGITTDGTHVLLGHQRHGRSGAAHSLGRIAARRRRRGATGRRPVGQDSVGNLTAGRARVSHPSPTGGPLLPTGPSC